MKQTAHRLKFPRPSVLLITLLLSALLISSCGLVLPSGDASLEGTAMALAVEVTLNAMEEAGDQEAAQDDGAELTQVAAAVQSTLTASEPTAAPPTTAPTAAPTEAPQPTPVPPTAAPTAAAPDQPTAPEAFEDWMGSAHILLYEDMAGVYNTTRYVQEALDNLGLEYVDVKDAVGHFKEQLLGGGPGGEGWDLIISAKEARGLVKGEIYVYLNDSLQDGSSLIVEEWEMDDIVRGKIAGLLNQCDVEFQEDWNFVPPKNQLLWQVDGSLPIHHTPNESIKLTGATGYWPTADLGDFMRLAPGSEAEPLWTSYVKGTDNNLTAVSCLDNRLILQTYSTHSYAKNQVVRMWENYIYHALQARYQTLNGQP